ncbi:MAG: hypothetical protein IBX67_06540 [Dehalococcoidia bacterium]|nr:hypothetical protein [Dehalococcoidia bacterium]
MWDIKYYSTVEASVGDPGRGSKAGGPQEVDPDGRMARPMKRQGDVRETRKGVGIGGVDGSWFRDSPHYWAEASLPLASAVVCVEVVCHHSEKAGMLYDTIVKAWGESGVKAVSGKVGSMIGESGKEKIRQAALHPERHLLLDPNRPFMEFRNVLGGVEAQDDLLKFVDQSLKKGYSGSRGLVTDNSGGTGACRSEI